MKYIMQVILCLVIQCFVAYAIADEFVAQVLASGAKIVTAPEVKHMLEVESKTHPTLLIHTLSQIEFNIQRIPSSINIPVVEIETTDKLPSDKTTRLIFYCMGYRCLYSGKASLKVAKMGYRNIYWFRGGIPEWYRFHYKMIVDESLAKIRNKRLSPAKVLKLKTKHNPIILDVRPLYWTGPRKAIPDSIFIPLVKLHIRYQELPKDKPIIIVDGYMKQSPSAGKFLASKGYKILGVVKGGIIRWIKEGYETVPMKQVSLVK